MPTFNIGPSRTYLSADATLYAALSGGSTVNLVYWDALYRYTPVAGAWWGRRAATGAMDKAVEHIPLGGDTVLVDGRLYPPTMTGSPYCTYYGSGVWRVETCTAPTGAVDATDPVFEMFVGVGVPGALASSFIAGTPYKMAVYDGVSVASTVAARVNSSGATKAGMEANNGVWFAAKEASTVDGSSDAAVAYIWTGSASIRPDVYWGGLAFTTIQGATGTSGSPRYSPFVLTRSAGNNPSGTILRPGFIIAGAPYVGVGSPQDANTTASRPITTVQYQGFKVLGGDRGLRLGSNAAGTTLTDFILSQNWTIDSLIVPDYYPAYGASNGSEQVSLDLRVKGFQAIDGTIFCGSSHAALALGPGGAATAEERSVNTLARRVRCIARAGAGDARSLEVKNSDNTTVDDCEFVGFPTKAQIGGTGTLLQGNTWRQQWGNPGLPADGRCVVEIRAFGEVVPTSISVRFYRNTIDRRGDTGRGVSENFACFAMRAAGNSISDNALDAQNNLFLTDAGTDAFWISEQGGNTVSKTQKYVSNWTNSTVPSSYTAVGVLQGVPTPLSTMLATGTYNDNVQDTSGNILLRRDLPTNPAMEVALAAAGDGIRWEAPIDLSSVVPASGTHYIRNRNFWSTGDATPCILFNTTYPVVIENCRLSSPYHCIQSLTTGASLTMVNSVCEARMPATAGESRKRVVSMYQPDLLDLRNNDATGAGFYADGGARAPLKVNMQRNRVWNVDGRKSQGASREPVIELSNSNTYWNVAQLFQLNNLPNIPDGEIAWNSVINSPGISRPEDLTNMYASGGTVGRWFPIHHNLLMGNYASRPVGLTSYSGVGLLAEQANSRYITYTANRILQGSLGANIANGANNVILDANRFFSTGAIGDQLLGYRNTSSAYGDGTNVQYTNTVSSWRGPGAGAVTVGLGGAATNVGEVNLGVPTQAQVDAEVAAWLAEAAAAGYTLGSTLSRWW